MTSGEMITYVAALGAGWLIGKKGKDAPRWVEAIAVGVTVAVAGLIGTAVN